ncbi:MAG: UvrD-helicase domain-containing protein [Actinobacteria bacterium]|nr:UvrD-helicase domain-containing protein [Actinomycetota bacterium]
MAVVASVPVRNSSLGLSNDRVFDLAWKRALETNCAVVKEYFSSLDADARRDYLAWIKKKRYSGLGADQKRVDEILERGLAVSYQTFLETQRIRERELELFREQVEAFKRKCNSELEAGYTDFESFNAEAMSLGISPEDFQGIRNDYVRGFLSDCGLGATSYFDVAQLDAEQLWAIGQDSKSSTLIAARAGSGKTLVLAVRAFYLIRRFSVAAEGMVMLAFNRAASLELKSRIAELFFVEKQLNPPVVTPESGETASEFQERVAQEYESHLRKHGQALPLVTTFHALARGVVFSAANVDAAFLAGIVTDDSDERTVRTDYVNSAIARVLERSGSSRFVEMMLEHFQTDWIELLRHQAVGQNQLLAEEYARSSRLTLSGHAVRSHGEKVISDFLFVRDINYRYERPTPGDNSVSYPDFTITAPSSAKLVIEYFGLEGRGSYDKQTQDKLRQSRIRNIPILSIFPRDIADGGFASKILEFLHSNGYSSEQTQELHRDVLWEKLEVRGKTTFNGAVLSFIDRASQRSLSPELISRTLPQSLMGQTLSGSVLDFSYLSVEVFREYLSLLDENAETDFYQILQNATRLLSDGFHRIGRTGQVRDLSLTTHVFVDEFQDFSELFQNLVDTLLATGIDPALTAVGDSWQSINSFMGSDETIIENFEKHYPRSTTLTLLRNHRSRAEIVSVGNAVMVGVAGKPSVPTIEQAATTAIYDARRFNISQDELQAFRGEGASQLIRILDYSLKHCDEVVVLHRFKDFKLKDVVLEALPADLARRIRFSTVHKFKGKEADAIVLWDATDSVYPFVHDSWVFNRFFGVNRESILREDQRLFYVAATRAKSMLLVTTDGFPTPFLEGVTIGTRPWPESEIAGTIAKGQSFFQVFLTGSPIENSLREALKKKSFVFRDVDTAKFWELHIRAQDDLDTLDPEQWVRKVWESLFPAQDPMPGSKLQVQHRGVTKSREIPR